jgi:hypothetical protein
MAIKFDGVDDYLHIANSPSWSNITGDISFSCWAYHDGSAGVFHAALGSTWKWICRLNADNTINTSLNCAGWQSLTSTGTYPENTWFHYAYSRIGNNATIYINGVSAGTSGSIIGSMATEANCVIRLAMRVDGLYEPLKATLEDYRVFNRGISGEEAAALAAGYRGPLGGEVQWQSMCEAGGTDYYDLDGANDYIECGSDPSIDNLSSYSIALWINPDSFALNNRTICPKGNFSTTGGWSFYTGLDAGSTSILRSYQGFSTTGGWWATTDKVISTGAWQHVVMTYNKLATTNDPVFYVNGISKAVTEGQTPVGSAVDDSDEPLYIGQDWAGSANSFFDGKIEDFRLFNRILSQSEITALASVRPYGPLGDEVLRVDSHIGHWDNLSLIRIVNGATTNVNPLPDLSGVGSVGEPYGRPVAQASDCPRMGVALFTVLPFGASIYLEGQSSGIATVNSPILSVVRGLAGLSAGIATVSGNINLPSSQSSDVALGDYLLASWYNSLREDVLSMIQKSPVELTISAGAISYIEGQSLCQVDTEGGAAADQLQTINGGVEGDTLCLTYENAARIVTVVHGTGNIVLGKGINTTLDDGWLVLTKRYDGKWMTVMKGKGGEGADVPPGAIALFTTSCPTGWTQFSALNGKYPVGAAAYGGTGGAATHTHGYTQYASHTHGVGSMAPDDTGVHSHYIYGRQTTSGGYFQCTWNVGYEATIYVGAAGSHVHTISGTTANAGDTSCATDPTNHEPPYLDMVFCQKD